MSRSFVKRGWACATTATPPTTTKSTRPSTRRRMSRLGRNSGHVATRAFPGRGYRPPLLVHRFETRDSFNGGESKMPADQAFVHRRAERLGGQVQPATGGAQCAVHGVDGRIRVGALQSGNDRLGRSQASGELLLRERGGASALANERSGGHDAK